MGGGRKRGGKQAEGKEGSQDRGKENMKEGRMDGWDNKNWVA